MSDNGRKRSRKTKLVPRDFSDFIDDDCFLQEPPFKIPSLNKRKRNDGETSSGSGSLEFSVKVEVEDIDSLPEEDPSNYMKYLFSLSQGSSQEDVDEDERDKKTQDQYSTFLQHRTYIMDTNKMFKAFRGLLRKYPQEKEAVIHTKNAWGKVFHEKPNEQPPPHPQHTELQKVIAQWRVWQFSSRAKETPFCYKCYICWDAWWTLMDFKDHIRSHADCKIQLEVIQLECHIIAYKGPFPEPVDIPIDGKCLKCAKTYTQHQDSKTFTDYRYYCAYCKDQFLTCRALNRHEGICTKNPIRTTPLTDDIKTNQNKFTEYTCKICRTTFLTKPEKNEHMSVCHRVRSDEPIPTHGKICRTCNGTFYIYCYHVCAKKNIIHECKHCHGKFQNKQMLQAHLASWDKPFTCRICDKIIMRQCMSAEHYAKHSENFVMMYRCLPCAKLKLFETEVAFRIHRAKTHQKADNRRPCFDRIIVPKVMLEQCEFNPNSRRRSSSKRLINPAPVKADTRTSDDTIEGRTTSSSTENKETLAAEDNDSVVSESSQNIPEDSKDFVKILDQITETLDIKPEIIVKEEKLSDSEDSKSDLIKVIEQTEQKEQAKIETDIPPAVREQSNKFKQIIQEVQEIKLSNIFQASKNVVQPEIAIKEEIKEEPDDFDDDLIILDSSNESIKRESGNSDLLNLEPEVILKAGYRKRKIYKCNKCNFEGYHREYKEHVNNHCRTPSKHKSLESTDNNFTCTKCRKSFETLKSYAQHFVDHNYRFMTCPQCVTMFDSITKLVTHINTHVKNQFVRMQLIHSANDERIKLYQCKTCKEVIESNNTFTHWEGHLKILSEPEKKQNAVAMHKFSSRPENALEPEVLKRILDIFQRQDQDRIEGNPPKKIKDCFVCHRCFERQNDCKRHLVEHLLEDAYAKLDETQNLKCQICSELHKKPDVYKKHMRDHASLPIYQCGLCNKTFSDSSNFTKHKKVHNLKAYVCDICNKKFQAKFSLEKHVQMHMSTDPFRCERCDRVFFDRSFFRRHVRQHHDRPLARFTCMICKQRFESLRLKWDHMWIVHKQRKDKADCPICKKSYRKISDVKKHSLTEHGFNVSLANVFQLVDKYHAECDKVVENLKNQTDDASSDDDVLLIEEERETLVIYDD